MKWHNCLYRYNQVVFISVYFIDHLIRGHIEKSNEVVTLEIYDFLLYKHTFQTIR